jgi:import inner membrane translocase subunit TIM9
MDSFNRLPEYQKAEFMKHLEEQQVKDSLRMYNNLVESCFDKCVTSFRSKQLEEGEAKCMTQCTEKFLKLTQRVGFRYNEYQNQKVADPK